MWYKRRIRPVILTVLLLAVAVFGPVKPVGAGHQLYDGSGTIPLHWNGFSWGNQITIVDRTQPWPVSTATSDWNNAHHEALVHYHWFDCSHGVNCVWVNEINSSSASYVGAFFASFNGTGHLIQNQSQTYINLNNAHLTTACSIYGITWATCRAHTACQEIGHALGLDHYYVGTSCMDDTLANSQSSHGGFDKTKPYTNGTHDDHDQLHTTYHPVH